MPNNWISFVKEFASKNNLKYRDAMSAPECKKQYREKYGETKNLPIEMKKKVVVVETVPAVSSEKMEGTGMKRPKLVKGSQEAKEYMKMLRDKRGTMKKQEKKMMGKGKGGLFEEEDNEWELFDEGELLDEMELLDKKPDNEETNKMDKLVKKPKRILTEEEKKRMREYTKKYKAANKAAIKKWQELDNEEINRLFENEDDILLDDKEMNKLLEKPKRILTEEQKQRTLEKYKRYYAKNREKKKAKYQENKEKIKAQQKELYEKNIRLGKKKKRKPLTEEQKEARNEYYKKWREENKMMGKGKGGLFEEEGNEWELFDEGELLDEMEVLDKKPDNEETNKMDKLVKKPKIILTEEQKRKMREYSREYYSKKHPIPLTEEQKRKKREYAKKKYAENIEAEREKGRRKNAITKDYRKKWLEEKRKLIDEKPDKLVKKPKIILTEEQKKWKREHAKKKYAENIEAERERGRIKNAKKKEKVLEQKSGTVPAVSSEKMEGTGMKRPKLVKGSQEAKDYMKMLRDKRGKEENKMEN